jgi:hypothetical protein
MRIRMEDVSLLFEGKKFPIYVCNSQSDTVLGELDNLTFQSD